LLRRKFNFFISDFASEAGGFTASDFDSLVSRGTIEIKESFATDDSEPLIGKPSDQAPVEEDRVLPDVLEPGCQVVFCGTAVGTRSAEIRAYYAGSGNQFWPVLARLGLTPRLLSPSEFRNVAQYGVGLTDLARFTSGGDADIAAGAFDADAFRRKIEQLHPKAIGFNGKRAAETYLGRKVVYGRQPETIGEAAIFALPSTSGAARGYWNESHWEALAAFLR